MFGCLNLSSAFGGSSPARRVQCAALNLDGLKCLQAAILGSRFGDLHKSGLTWSKPEKYATGLDTDSNTETQPPEDNFGTEKSPNNSNSGYKHDREHERGETLAIELDGSQDAIDNLLLSQESGQQLDEASTTSWDSVRTKFPQVSKFLEKAANNESSDVADIQNFAADLVKHVL